MTDLRQTLTDTLSRHRGANLDVTVDAVIAVINEMGAQRCRDRDCIRLLPHRQLNPHRWLHRAQPPFTRTLLGWTCFMCGRRAGHRIHRKGPTP